jgi:hypothetical protein
MSTPDRVSLLALLTLPLLASACRPDGQKPSASDSVEIALGPTYCGDKPDTLPRCMTELNYFSDANKRAEELFRVAATIREKSGWTDNPTQRCAKGGANCSRKTSLAVRVIADANQFSPTRNSKPVAIALLERGGTDQLTEAYYNVGYKDTVAPYAAHVLVVLPSNTDTSKWQLWSVRQRGDRTFVADSANAGTFEPCNHEWVPVSTGNFDGCDRQRAKINAVDSSFQFLAAAGARKTFSTAEKLILSQVGMSLFEDLDATTWGRSPDGPAWVSCGLGCCTPRL